MVHSFLIKYGEIGIKGKNRNLFEDALARTVRQKLVKVGEGYTVRKERGRIYVNCPEGYDQEAAIDALQHVFGIVGICPVVVKEKGDAEQLKRVVSNIVSNSVKYMDKTPSCIDLRILDAGDFIQVEIEDNGKGIETKELVNIFDRFYRTDVARSNTQNGSGIGLSIVRKIIEDHGGKIWAGSKIGQGTVMYFVLRKSL